MQSHEFPFKRLVTVCHSCVGVGIGSFMIQTGIKNSTKGHARSLLMIVIKWFVHVCAVVSSCMVYLYDSVYKNVGRSSFFPGFLCLDFVMHLLRTCSSIRQQIF